MEQQRFNPDIHHRRSIRLSGHDYTRSGAYFVTVCSQERECLFGVIINGVMELNDAGRMVQSVWNEMPDHYLGVQADAFVVMPNHVHGIIVLIESNVGAGPRTCPDQRNEKGQPRGVAPTMSLPDVVHRFKLMTTTRYRWGIEKQGWMPFNKRLWQRNYYEHVIRNDDDLMKIRQYIEGNPIQWKNDENHPENIPVL